MEEFAIQLLDGFGNTIDFTSLEDLSLFFEREAAEWSWVNEVGYNLADVRPRFTPNFSSIQSWIQQYRDKAFTPQQLRDNIVGLYNQQRPALLFSGCAPGTTIALIRDRLDPDQAGLALAMLIGLIEPDLRNLQHARLWFMLASPSGIEPDIWAHEEREKLSRARDALRRELSSHRQKILAQQEELTDTNITSRERYRRMAALAFRVANKRAVRIRESAIASIEAINTTNTAFTQQMHLKAPVGYWKGKQTKHRVAAICWAIAFALYLVIATCLGISLFEKAWANADGNGFTGKHFLLVAGIGTVLTLIFWISRILMRIFLGELHLYTDAAERGVMTETYLALIKEGAATEQERALILAALFRSAQDGIVREDVGGEVGLAAIAAKLLEGKK